MSSTLLHEGKRHRGRDGWFLFYRAGNHHARPARTPAGVGMEGASEPWTRTHPKISPQAPGHICFLKVREKDSPLLDTAHRITGLPKNLWEQKVRLALELATV